MVYEELKKEEVEPNLSKETQQSVATENTLLKLLAANLSDKEVFYDINGNPLTSEEIEDLTTRAKEEIKEFSAAYKEALRKEFLSYHLDDDGNHDGFERYSITIGEALRKESPSHHLQGDGNHDE